MTAERYWEARWRDEARENDRLNELLRAAKIDHLLAKQLQRAIVTNGRYRTALLRIQALDPKNVEKYAQQIAGEALVYREDD